jgi:hydrogenase maturation protease
VWQAGLQPERCLHRLAGRYDHVVFLDATDFGGAAGDVVFLAGSEIRARFPQISTHRLALGMLAAWVESDGRTRAWLLGVQPANLGFGARMTPAVAASVEVLAGILTGLRSNLLARDVDRDSDPLAEDDQGAGAAPAHSGDAAPC